MAGAPKLGKSWLGLGLAIAVASGGYALGKVGVVQGDVLYLALEDNARRLQDRLRLVLNGDSAPDGFHLELEWPRLDDGGGERLDDWLSGHPNARLVLVDVYPGSDRRAAAATCTRPTTREPRCSRDSPSGTGSQWSRSTT